MPHRPLLPAARHEPRPAFHQPAYPGDGIVHRAVDCRRHRLHHAAGRGISASGSANRRGHDAISGSFRANRFRHGGGADRAADQRRRGHALPLQPGDIERPAHDHGDVQARHRSRQGAGAGPEPRRDRAAATAGRGAAQRRRHAQEQSGHIDGRVHAVAGRQFRPALHFQLRAIQVRDQLLRLDGIGDIQIFGARDYSMRLWLDPDKIANLGLTSGDVVAAIRAQNLQIAGGQLASPPIADRAFQPNLTFVGRLKDPSQFEDIVVKSSQDGRIVRLRDVSRIELGALDYSTNSFLLRKSAVAMRVAQRPGSNALATAEGIKDTMEKLKPGFPKGLDYNIGYNPTEFIAQSIQELIKTIYEAMLLVVIVVLVFLQGWRPAIIPIIAIPVSLVGTFAAMAALGYAINNLTLFGLVLAVGIVVDDAIVVVENVERHLALGLSRRDAALKTMEEVGGALVSIALVLCAVFVPTAFLGGITGQFFQQFAVTIAVATAISCFCSLTLSPALASQILIPHEEKRPPAAWNLIARGWEWFTGLFNRGFDWASHRYAGTADFVIRHRAAMLLVYVI